jgi:hypothetical protein
MIARQLESKPAKIDDSASKSPGHRDPTRKN